MKKHPIVRVYAENRKYIPGLIVILLFSLLAGLFKMFSSTLWGKAVDFGVGGRVNEMLLAAAAMAAVILLDCTRTAVHYHIIGHVTEGLFLDLRQKAFGKINKGKYQVLENQFRTGDTATRVNNDIDSLSNFIAGDISNLSRLIFQGLFAVGGCVALSWQLSAAYFVLLPVSLWLVKKISKPIETQSRKSMDSTGSSMSLAADAFGGILTVKAFNMQGAMSRRFAGSTDEAYRQQVKSERIGMKMTGIKYAVSVIQLMTLFLVGSALVSGGMLSVGSMLAFITLSGYITEPFNQIDYMIRTVRTATAAAQRIFEVLDIPDEENGSVIEAAGDACVEGRNIRFAYSAESEILRGVDLKIAGSQRVAVIGPSGCGKSTLIKLICRFYLPQSGSLKLFGAPSEEWRAEALRKNMALVTQESCLFDGTIYENIAYGRAGATRAECEHALKEVRLWDFVSRLEGGMDHPIGEFGHQLSGGQKQRLCIARAMVKKAPLVLLDEATSALDSQSEKEVQEALDRLLEGKAAVIVAHRLTTVQNADYIYCLENGAVVEEGTPAELTALKGMYYRMCLAQGLTEVRHD